MPRARTWLLAPTLAVASLFFGPALSALAQWRVPPPGQLLNRAARWGGYGYTAGYHARELHRPSRSYDGYLYDGTLYGAYTWMNMHPPVAHPLPTHMRPWERLHLHHQPPGGVAPPATVFQGPAPHGPSQEYETQTPTTRGPADMTPGAELDSSETGESRYWRPGEEGESRPVFEPTPAGPQARAPRGAR